jgi:hypothetical protein
MPVRKLNRWGGGAFRSGPNGWLSCRLLCFIGTMTACYSGTAKMLERPFASRGGARPAPRARKPQTVQAVAIALTEKGSSATEKHLSRMACSPMPELSYIVVAWAPSTVGHSCAVFAARSSVSMRRDRTALHVCGCCTRATRCTSFRTPKEDWLSGRPASRAMIIRLFPCAALLSS